MPLKRIMASIGTGHVYRKLILASIGTDYGIHRNGLHVYHKNKLCILSPHTPICTLSKYNCKIKETHIIIK